MTLLLKYCGNHFYEDYKLAVSSHAQFIGFIFYEGSPRYVAPETVASWVDKTPKKKQQQLVGVFVNPTLETIENTLNHVPLDVVQLHGTESLPFVQRVKLSTQCPVWKAIHHEQEALQIMQLFHGEVDGFIVDVKTKEAWGGTGQSFDWRAIPRYTKEAIKQSVPCLIAGGITPSNVEELLGYQPQGIDLASGIEANGRKSKDLITELEGKVVQMS
ncbi:N-(5'-phosphoribosyl)anthranilate isomerase [Pullulanibacillus camelliae]|uniref:N-(5'-phosphoribosyl)anthranilate isomerase n=1 Tax=Pullulanibacillus camelliae TaxID=1707096 RepID=A0A8J2VRG4_9BACL|nr:phosphoribosylanthranilate isomerase [Pullulanibacillus camelliae]GGE38803.1 N-(5'-phosphoribosyl)anthranilate isomerase [Pullulanibacillus camelliae]